MNNTSSKSQSAGHFLQSILWENFQKSRGKEIVHGSGKDFSFMATVERTPVGKYLLIPYGPYTASPSALPKALDAIRAAAKSHGAIFARIEPTTRYTEAEMRHFGARKVKDVDPAETWVVDISDTDNLKEVFPRRLRGYYNTHADKDIEIIVSHNPADIKHLVRLQAKTFKAKNITPYSETYLASELSQDFATLYLAKYEHKIIAAILVFDDSTTRYYMQAASDKDYAKLNANGIITIQSRMDASKNGLKNYDFWGIAPDNAPADHPWAGFTSFKKSFHGEEIHYSGTYDLPFDHFRYFLYKFLRKFKSPKR